MPSQLLVQQQPPSMPASRIAGAAEELGAPFSRACTLPDSP